MLSDHSAVYTELLSIGTAEDEQHNMERACTHTEGEMDANGIFETQTLSAAEPHSLI